MKDLKTVQLDKETHAKLTALAERQGKKIRYLLTEMIEHFDALDTLPNAAEASERKDIELKAMNERLMALEKDIRKGFNMVTTNQEKFGRASTSVYQKILKHIEILMDRKTGK